MVEIARAKNMSQLARDTGLTREGLRITVQTAPAKLASDCL
jgi:DNA-binding phage protein